MDLKSWRHPYFQKTSVFSDSTTTTQRSTGGQILHEWMCYLKMQRSLILHEEAHFQTGKWVHNVLWKPLEVWVSLVSLQKLPCLHSSHSALVTICEPHFKLILVSLALPVLSRLYIHPSVVHNLLLFQKTTCPEKKVLWVCSEFDHPQLF